jgi:hypothetical protein
MIDDHTLTKLLAYFETVYAERLAYRAIAENLPDWKEKFDSLMAEEARPMASETFSGVKKSLDMHQRVLEILQNLSKNKPIH